MKFHQLYYFKVLAENGNLTRTSKILSISPPALRRAIRELEEEYQCTLFDHVGRTIVLNKRGIILLRHAENIFHELDCIESDINNAIYNQEDKILQVGCTEPYIWNRHISRFLQENPNVLFEQASMLYSQLKDSDNSLEKRIIIAGTGDLLSDEWNFIDICKKNPPVLLVHKDHKFSKLDHIDLITAKEECFLRANRTTSIHKWEETLFREAGFFPKQNNECVMDICKAVMSCNDKYVYLTSRFSYEMAGFGSDIVAVPLSDPIIDRTYCLYWHKHRHLTKADHLFIEFMKNHNLKI